MEIDEKPPGSGETPAEEGARKLVESAADAEPTPPAQTSPEAPDAPDVAAEASDSEPEPPPVRTRLGLLEEPPEQPVAVSSRVLARQSRRDFVLFGIGAGTVIFALAVGKILAWLFPLKRQPPPPTYLEGDSRE